MENLASDEISRFYRRRQFIIGPKFVDALSGWRRIEECASLVGQAHPDLGVTRVSNDNFTAVLLGFLLDPENPEHGDARILQGLLDRARSARNVIDATEPLGGRWVLLVDDGVEPLLFTDPCGLREVYYTTETSRGFWCASQSGLLADALGLAPSSQARAFLRSDYFVHSEEPWWPGTSCPVEGVRRLLPNHVLRISSGTVERFWPTRRLDSFGVEDGAEMVAKTVTGIIRSAHQRFRLALPLTGGHDSRLLAAATRACRDTIWYYTIQMPALSRWSPDLRIPRRILRRAGQPHHVVRCVPRLDQAFWEVYSESVDTAHQDAALFAQSLLVEFPENHVSISGHCGEVLRGFYPQKRASEIGGTTLATWAGMRSSPFAVQQFEAWLQGARSACERFDHSVSDLFYWEQRLGRWAANGQAQWDLIHERVSPFNCRNLLSVGLSVTAERSQAESALAIESIRRMWPQLLLDPINPNYRPWSGRLQAVARRLKRVVARRWNRLVHGRLTP